MHALVAIPFLAFALSGQTSSTRPHPSHTLEEVDVCSITNNPLKYSGRRVILEADVLADGMHGSALIGASCQRGIVPDFDKAPAAGDEYGKAIFTGRPGTIDKDIHARFLGRFVVFPWNHRSCRESRMMETTRPCYFLEVESMTGLKITFKPGEDPRPPNIERLPPMTKPEPISRPSPQHM